MDYLRNNIAYVAACIIIIILTGLTYFVAFSPGVLALIYHLYSIYLYIIWL